MPEPTVVEPQVVPSVVNPAVKSEPDLITKVTQFKKETVQPEGVDINFDYKELENIKDPVAKEVAMKAYKSMQAGATKKFQEASQLKKEAEEKLKSVEKKQWTPELIQKELLNDPQFLSAAQLISGNNNNTESSLLSDEEKAEMNRLKNKVMTLEQSNQLALISQEDAQLSSKFSDYNSVRIDEALSNLVNTQPHKLREYVYKATFHDEHVKAAYEMGLQESKKNNQEKINAFSANGSQVNSSENIPVKDKGESDTAYFIRLAQSRMAQMKK